MYIVFTPEEVKKLLQNSATIKNDCRCLECHGTGWYSYDENGDNITAGLSNNPDKISERCEECNGVGFSLMGIGTVSR